MKWTSCGIILSVIVLVSALFDLSLSYFAYQRDHVYFITHEANREIIPFFVDGVFPYFYFFGILFLITLIFVLVRIFHEIEKQGFKRESKQLLFCYYWIFGISSLNHILGGLTWYDQHKILVIFVSALYVFVFIVGIFTGIVGLHVVYLMQKKQ